MPKVSCFFSTALLVGFSFSLHASPEELTSTLADQKHLAVTIYNDNLALIKDQRTISLPSGHSALAFREISAQIQPETALLRSLSTPNSLSAVEQNFDFDLLSPQKLLEKYIGKQIGIIKTHPTTGEEHTEFGTLLSTHQGAVIKIGDRIETGHRNRFVFPSVPDNLRDKPTLTMQINNAQSETQNLELSYLTQGLGWKADYVMSINKDDTKMDLNGWVTLTNTSGTHYPNAQLQLVAGSINRAPQTLRRNMRMEVDMVTMAASEPMTQESLFEYHLYTLGHKTTLNNNQTKQVALLSASNIPIKKELRLQGHQHYYYNRAGDLGRKLPVEVYTLFENDKKNHLGIPLPKGVIRAYKQDRKGSAQFIGEDSIQHTPKNETVRIKLGSAFDVTASKKQTDYQRIATKLVESEYLITLNNAKNESVTVTVVEPIPGDWKIVNESHPHQKSSSSTATWLITVPAESKTQLTYRVQIK